MDIIKTTKRDVHIEYVEMLLNKAKWTSRCCGTWPYDNNWLYTLLATVLLATSMTIVTCQHVFIFHNYDKFDYIIGAYSTMFTVVIVCIKQLLFIKYRKSFIRLLDVVKNDFWPINSLDDDSSTRKLLIILNKCFSAYLLSIIIFSQVWMFFPLVAQLPGHRKMPIVCWYPFNVDKSPVYEIVYSIIILICLYMALGVYAYDYIFFQFVTHICVQYKLIQKCLQLINTQNRDDKHVYDELIFCVKHHILLKKFYEELEVILNANNLVHLSIASFALGALLYLIQCEQDPVRVFKLFLYMIVVAIALAMYCFAGTALEEASTSVSYAAFESNWPEAHPRLRLGLIRFIQMSQVPLRLSSYGMIFLNNPLYVSVWKTAFSMSTLMLNMKVEEI